MFPLLLLVLIFTHTWALDNVFWEAYGYSTQGTRFSPLADINVGNVNKLVVNWKYSIGEDDAGGSRQATPIVVDDGTGNLKSVLVFCTQYNSIIALDPTNGALRWRQDTFHNRDIPRTWYYCRGVSTYLNPIKKNGENCRRSIFMSTIDFQLVSVDASSGVPCSDFGINGSVFVLEDKKLVDPSVWDLRNPPVVVDGVVAISPQIVDGQKQNITKGPTWAFNATTGKPMWTFYPIPRNQTDPAYGSWLNGTDGIGGGNVWPIMSGDNDLKLIFMPVGSASPDAYGGGRPGDNRHTSSLVAVNAHDGTIRWSYQIVRHDIWDMDVACQPTISKIENRTVVLIGTKAAMIWMFDAVTGEPIPRPRNIIVPQSDVPGEVISPIQQIPGNDSLLLLPLEVNETSIWGPPNYTEERQNCLDWFYNLTGRQSGQMFTPPSLKGSLLYPPYLGGINWGGCAANSGMGTFTCVVKNNLAAVQLIPQNTPPPTWCNRTWPQTDTPYYLCRRIMTSGKGFPCIPPPWTELVMLDMKSFEVKWRAPLGYVLGMPDNGYRIEWGATDQTGGVMQTQGGLIFVTGTEDKHLWIYEAETGKRIFYMDLPWTSYMTPITYRQNDKQYIVVLSTNSTNGEIIAWSLPPITYDWETIFGVTFGGLGVCILIVAVTAFLKKHSKGYTRIPAH